MKRRSFLQLMGLAATAPVLAKLPQGDQSKILKPGDIKRESLHVPPKYGNRMMTPSEVTEEVHKILKQNMAKYN